MDILYSLCFGIFLGTFGLAWSHYFVHMTGGFNSSIIWKYHKQHHKKDDPEYTLKSGKYCIIEYGILSMLKYFDPFNWTSLDYFLYFLGCMFPLLGLSFLIGIYISENIGYLQHTRNNYPVNFTNRFDNLIGLNCGNHAEHHGVESKYFVETQVIFGIIMMYVWAAVCISIYPIILIVNEDKANFPGVYCFGFIQNIRNYKKENGINIRKLLYRMPSIFDKPVILVQYIKLMFNYKELTTKYAHSISDIRNIYNFIDNTSTFEPTIYKGCIYDGHHRYTVKEGLSNETKRR